MSLPKCVETIYRLPYVGKEIVHPSGKPETRGHNRYGHWFGNPAEFATGNRGSFDPDRSRDEHRQGLDPGRQLSSAIKGARGINYPVSPSLLSVGGQD